MTSPSLSSLGIDSGNCSFAILTASSKLIDCIEMHGDQTKVTILLIAGGGNYIAKSQVVPQEDTVVCISWSSSVVQVCF